MKFNGSDRRAQKQKEHAAADDRADEIRLKKHVLNQSPAEPHQEQRGAQPVAEVQAAIQKKENGRKDEVHNSNVKSPRSFRKSILRRGQRQQSPRNKTAERIIPVHEARRMYFMAAL